MASNNGPRQPHPRLRLLPSRTADAAPLPLLIPLLRPDTPISAAEDARLTALAHRAHDGNTGARDLLWRAFAARLEPSIRRCGYVTWQVAWAKRDGRPWALDDLRQEAWLVFVDLVAHWEGEGSFIPYISSHFPWRLRQAMRRLGPLRQSVPLGQAEEHASSEPDDDPEIEALLAAIAERLAPSDVLVLDLRVRLRLSLEEIGVHLGVNRRTISRQWARIRREAYAVLVG